MNTEQAALLQTLQTDVRIITEKLERDREDRKSLDDRLTSSIDNLAATTSELCVSVGRIDTVLVELNNTNERQTTHELSQNRKTNQLETHLSMHDEQIRDLQINQAGLIETKNDTKQLKFAVAAVVLTTILNVAVTGLDQIKSPENDEATKALIKIADRLEKSPN
jgi:hypothetical protein